MSHLPFIAVGHGELDKARDIKGTVKCYRCGKRHRVRLAKDSDGVPTHLSFFKCGGKIYLAGINGKVFTPKVKT